MEKRHRIATGCQLTVCCVFKTFGDHARLGRSDGQSGTDRPRVEPSHKSGHFHFSSQNLILNHILSNQVGDDVRSLKLKALEH
jgi:hypothetical protein